LSRWRRSEEGTWGRNSDTSLVKEDFGSDRG
jgi:hypothetical protein